MDRIWHGEVGQQYCRGWMELGGPHMRDDSHAALVREGDLQK